MFTGGVNKIKMRKFLMICKGELKGQFGSTPKKQKRGDPAVEADCAGGPPSPSTPKTTLGSLVRKFGSPLLGISPLVLDSPTSPTGPNSPRELQFEQDFRAANTPVPDPDSAMTADESINKFFEECEKTDVSESNTKELDSKLMQVIDEASKSPGPEHVPDPELKIAEKLLKEALAQGEVPTRGTLGTQFNRSLLSCAESLKAYAKLKGRVAKAKFRMEWGQGRWKEISSTRSRSTDYMKIDRTLGTYKTFGAIVVSLGGWSWPPAIEGAKNLVCRCALMGGEWVYHCPFTKMLKFMELDISNSTMLVNKWGEYKQYQGAGDAVAQGGAAGAVAAVAQGGGAGAVAAVAKAGAAQAPQGLGKRELEAQSQAPVKKLKAERDAAAQGARRHKATRQVTCSRTCSRTRPRSDHLTLLLWAVLSSCRIRSRRRLRSTCGLTTIRT